MKKTIALLLALSMLAMPVAAVAGQDISRNADPDWWESPRGTQYTPSFEYEWTDEWENAWNIFLDWSLMLLYYGIKGPM